MWNFTPAELAQLEQEIKAEGEPRKRKQRSEVEEYEKKPGRAERKKARTLNVSQEQSLEGEMVMGIFWPVAVYEHFFKKKVPKPQQGTYNHNGIVYHGIQLPTTAGYQDGCIRIISRSTNKIEVTNPVPVADDKVDSSFKRGAAQLIPKIKHMSGDAAQGGDNSGNYLMLSLAANANANKSKKRHTDDSDSDHDWDTLWGQQCILKSCGKAAKHDDDTPGDGKSRNNGIGKPRGAGSGSAGANTGTDKLQCGERRKRADAEQSAKQAILDGESLLSKIEDEELVLTVTTKNWQSAHKKVSDCLAPEKIRALTNGEDIALMLAAPAAPASGAADGDPNSTERLLQNLNSIKTRLDGTSSVITQLNLKERRGGGEERGVKGQVNKQSNTQ